MGILLGEACSPNSSAVWEEGEEEGRKVLHSTTVVLDIDSGTDVVVVRNRYTGCHSDLDNGSMGAVDLEEVDIDTAAVSEVEEEGEERKSELVAGVQKRIKVLNKKIVRYHTVSRACSHLRTIARRWTVRIVPLPARVTCVASPPGCRPGGPRVRSARRLASRRPRPVLAVSACRAGWSRCRAPAACRDCWSDCRSALARSR